MSTGLGVQVKKKVKRRLKEKKKRPRSRKYHQDHWPPTERRGKKGGYQKNWPRKTQDERVVTYAAIEGKETAGGITGGNRESAKCQLKKEGGGKTKKSFT